MGGCQDSANEQSLCLDLSISSNGHFLSNRAPPTSIKEPLSPPFSGLARDLSLDHMYVIVFVCSSQITHFTGKVSGYLRSTKCMALKQREWGSRCLEWIRCEKKACGDLAIPICLRCCTSSFYDFVCYSEFKSRFISLTLSMSSDPSRISLYS